MPESTTPADESPPASAPALVPPPPAAPPAEKPPIAYETFAALDLRIATVIDAREHPNANKLLLLQIDVGGTCKQIVAGIRGHYEPAQLVGRQIVVLNNLAPAMLRGEESQGMLLAASDGGRVVLLQPDAPLPSGAKVK